MVQEGKGENLGTGILYFPDFLYKRTKAGKSGEFLLFERMLLCQLKLAGDKFPTIREKFMKRFGKMAPCIMHVCLERHDQKFSP